MFTNALTRKPSEDFSQGITSSDLGLPDYKKAQKQHDAYVDVLRKCGLDVAVLDPLDVFPDSCFVEDTAVIVKECAIISRPGSLRRLGEEDSIKKEMERIMNVDSIVAAGTVD